MDVSLVRAEVLRQKQEFENTYLAMMTLLNDSKVSLDAKERALRSTLLSNYKKILELIISSISSLLNELDEEVARELRDTLSKELINRVQNNVLITENDKYSWYRILKSHIVVLPDDD